MTLSPSDGNLVLRNGNVLLPSGALQRADLRMADGLISEIGPRLRGAVEIDVRGAAIVPGLFDLHTHGMGLASAGPGSLAEYARLEAAQGATTLYPTLFAGPEISAEQMARHRRETDDLRALPQIGGFRLESPYLARTGAGRTSDLAPITPETTRLLLAAGGGHIKIWDVSPEAPGACPVIGELTAQGIVCSICHTQATIDEGRAAVEAGARLVTHLFDTFVVPVMTDGGVFPAGLVDYLLGEDRVVCEIIADGTHVPPLLVEIAFRCKTPTRLHFVTDSNVGAGLPTGEYLEPRRGDRLLVRGPNDGVRLLDRDLVLAGSALTPIAAFRNAIRLFGKDMATASRICSGTPARLMGLTRGEIGVGKDADLIVLDEQLELLHTICRGTVIYPE
jgi:N-acetylglucosamine-6-phosphate deacetylase